VKYLLTIYGNQEKWASLGKDEWKEAVAKQDAYNRKYRETGELLGAYGLGAETNAKVIRNHNGQPAVTDGPYLEAKEYLASFYLLEVDSDQRAREIAADMPWAQHDAVEMRLIEHEAPTAP
jgi:hypothetical protein